MRTSWEVTGHINEHLDDSPYSPYVVGLAVECLFQPESELLSELKVFRVGKVTRIVSSMKTALFLREYKGVAIV